MKVVNQMNIFSNSDYRDCISDYYHTSKATNQSFSLQILANRAGMTKMAVKYLIDKKRHSTEAGLEVLASAIGLCGNEKHYFYYLALFNKCKDPERKLQFLEKMLGIRQKYLGEKNLGDSEMGLFQGWIYPAIVELSCVRGFQYDAEWIQKSFKFHVPLQEIRDALNFLTEKGYFNSHVEPERPRLKLPDEVRSFVYKKYVKDLIEKGIEAVDKQCPQDREFFNITISVDQDRFDLAKKMISEFRHKLHDTLASDVKCDKVIQINMQMFTLAEGKKTK